MVVECNRERSVLEGTHGVRGGTGDREDAPDAPREMLTTPGPMGLPHRRLHELPEGPSPPSVLQRHHAEIRLARINEHRHATLRRHQRLQNDQGHLPQGGIHQQTPYGIHKTPGGLR